MEELKHHRKAKDYHGIELETVMDRYIYQYDLLGKKTEINVLRKEKQGSNTLDPSNGRHRYYYDPLNRLTKTTKNNESLREYRYDAYGNRTTLFENSNQTDYNYNTLNQLISSKDRTGNIYEYTYDNRGNLEVVKHNDKITHEYFYGDLNRLEEALNHDQEQLAVYKYNGLGNRVKQTINDLELNPIKQINDVIDLTRPYHNLLQRTKRNTIHDFVDDPNQAVSTFTYDFGVLNAHLPNATLHYHHDDLGSPIRITSDNWLKECVFGYDDFGNELYQQRNEQPFTYTGYQKDNVTGTLFAQAREYMPTVGRFVSEDLVKGVIQAPYTLNQYTYCWNDPMNLVDLDGLNPVNRPEAEQEMIDAAREHGISWLHIIESGLIAREARIGAHNRAEAAGTGTQGNIHDAYRHFQWMFRTSRLLSPETARFLGDFNEIQGLSGYGGQMIFHGDRFIIAYFNDYTLQDLWNNSVAFTMGANQDLESCLDDSSTPFFLPFLAPPATGFGHPPIINNSNRDPLYYRAFQHAIDNGLIMNNRSDAGRFFGIELDQDINGNPSARAIWDTQNNTIRFRGVNSGIIIDLYTDPINGPRH